MFVRSFAAITGRRSNRINPTPLSLRLYSTPAPPSETPPPPTPIPPPKPTFKHIDATLDYVKQNFVFRSFGVYLAASGVLAAGWVGAKQAQKYFAGEEDVSKMELLKKIMEVAEKIKVAVEESKEVVEESKEDVRLVLDLLKDGKGKSDGKDGKEKGTD